MFIYSKANQRRLVIIFILLSLILGLGFVAGSMYERNNSFAPDSSADDTEDSSDQIDEDSTKIDEIIAGMSLADKVTQLFIITPEALTGYDQVTLAGDATKEALSQYPVAGLIYFEDNLIGVEQVTTMLANVQQYAQEINGLELFTCIDEEGGTIARLGNNPVFGVPGIDAMSTVTSVDEAQDIGTTIGTYLNSYGFNVDFAPVADVLSNSANTVVGERSFGAEPQFVANAAVAVASGLADQGVLATFKHFPGHGATAGDTHDGYAYSPMTMAELEASDLIPFAAGIANEVPLIMVSHLALPEVTGTNVPCSLEPTVVRDMLRDQMGFEGLIITDALNMGAITNNYSATEAAIKAIEAGNDLLLMPEDFQAARSGLIEAVEAGTISKERIDSSLRRIIKAKLGLSPVA